MRAHAADPHAARIQAAMAAQDWELLTRHCRQALRKNGRHLLAHRYLGFALHKLRKTEDALGAYKQAAALWPEDAELLINYANTLFELRRNGEALPIFEKVCRLRPDHALSWIKLAQDCYEIGRHEQGFAAAQKAMALAQSTEHKVGALTQLAIHQREMGQIREAIENSTEAIKLTPDDPANHTNRLLFMLADPTTEGHQILEAAREFAEVFERPLKPQWPSFDAQRQGPWRRLRIGFISPDFRTHSVMYFIEGVLAQLDRRQFEVYGFYMHPAEDLITERVKRHVDHFIRLDRYTALEQATMVRQQQIDILIDLAGHTGHNALLAMAFKAAPVQATWIGFPGTTGLSAIDYLITDAETDPIGVEADYSERLYRLPNRLCVYRPMSRNPLWRYQPRYLVQPTPALKKGGITFGSCNNLGKLTDEVLSTWSEILRMVPNSRLLIEGKGFGNPELAESYRARCLNLGIASDRLELVPLEIKNQYLTYHDIDIALDPFPLNGGTTSMDVLWMGVPLVALEGTSFKSRLTTGILRPLGRSEWLAQSRSEYIRIAASLASDLDRLNSIRLNLREEVEQSPLMREDLFCQSLANALRDMWQTWLAEIECPVDPDQRRALREQWAAEKPAEWDKPPVPGVGLTPGVRVPLPMAHQKLMALVEKCKAAQPLPSSEPQHVLKARWKELTEMAETVLTAVPHDPVALACLAEVEFAHGHTDFAVTYLQYAQKSLLAQS